MVPDSAGDVPLMRAIPGALVLLAGLYFAQGLPFGFFTQALPVVLRRSGFSLVTISATGVLFLPWALKFLWAPYLDRFGTRRRWLIGLQMATAAVALVLATLDFSRSFFLLFVGIAVVNTLAASQDVVTDGVAVRMLSARNRGIGNGIQVGAYRIGMIVGGGGLLWLYALSGWRALFIVMAALLVLSSIPLWLYRTQVNASDVDSGAPEPRRLALMWWRRLRRPGMITLVLLVAGYKFGNSMGSALVGPFLSDIGLTLGQIAFIEGVLSSIGALTGAAVGAVIAHRYGRRRALLVAGVAQSAALVLYVMASLNVGGLTLIVVANATEHVFGGAATVAVFSLMMDAAERAHAGADYTLLACAVVFSQGIAGFAAAVVAQSFGYPVMFMLSVVLSAIGCAVLLRALARRVGPASLHESLPASI